MDIEPFTIMMPLCVLGEVEIGGERVDTSHYYHVLDGCRLKIKQGSKLVAIVVSDIK